MKFSAAIVAASALVLSVSAKDIYVQVGNLTANGPFFTPQNVVAALGDTVFFNFSVPGNHSAVQSEFASPCIPAHESNNALNGFNSGPRFGNNQSATILPVPITPDLENKTLWFYDQFTCGAGGVGGINVNKTSNETMDGFERNAKRLNGTSATTGPSSSKSGTLNPSPTSGTGGSSNSESEGSRVVFLGASLALPLILAALAL